MIKAALLEHKQRVGAACSSSANGAFESRLESLEKSYCGRGEQLMIANDASPAFLDGRADRQEIAVTAV